jgi:hypothetical protein
MEHGTARGGEKLSTTPVHLYFEYKYRISSDNQLKKAKNVRLELYRNFKIGQFPIFEPISILGQFLIFEPISILGQIPIFEPISKCGQFPTFEPIFGPNWNFRWAYSLFNI